MRSRPFLALFACLICFQSIGRTADPLVSLFQVQFDNCVESIGVGLAPTASVLAANLQLTTPTNSALASLLGGSEVGFPILQQLNGFDAATMNVAIGQ